MRYWETAHTVADQPPVALDFVRIWQAADKIVYSTTLQAPDTARTRIERDLDPVQVRKLKEAADRDLTVAARGSPPRPSRPGWWTNTNCSSSRPLWAAEPGPCRTRSA